jgi:hypothetical protein
LDNVSKLHNWKFPKESVRNNFSNSLRVFDLRDEFFSYSPSCFLVFHFLLESAYIHLPSKKDPTYSIDILIGISVLVYKVSHLIKIIKGQWRSNILWNRWCILMLCKNKRSTGVCRCKKTMRIEGSMYESEIVEVINSTNSLNYCILCLGKMREPLHHSEQWFMALSWYVDEIFAIDHNTF